MPEQQALIPYAREVVEVPVADEMGESFLAYSLSVITSRAIPDVRDGLKPVQRRILWAMLQMGVRPDTPPRKSARIVGDTMGRYHPHGDAAIYDALVRMGQDFARMVTFIDPQGNFGSLDDPPAAARYTECRLTPAAMDMVRELDEDTVDFRPTYDGEGEEPVVLPAALPNLLINGTSGIAVGMATNMAPHNPAEVAAVIELVMTKRRPKPTVDELMAVLPGPDFPSGGIVVDDGLRQAYETGRGTFRIRARAHVEQLTRTRQAIVVTELPYLVGAERVLAKLKELHAAGRLPGVSGFADLSDAEGTRLQIDCRAGVNPQAVLHELYRLTPLEETFGINNVVLVDGVPTTLGLHDLCRHWIAHRLQVVVRRTRHRLERARERLHILEGLLVALDAIDEVVAIIRSSHDAAEARTRLMDRFGLSDVQATHILDMPLRRLTALAKIELEEEADEKRRLIADYERILSSERRRRTLVLDELRRVVEAHGRERRTEIVSPDDLPPVDVTGLTAADADPDELDGAPCVVTLSTSGHLGRVPVSGARQARPGRHDLIAARVLTSGDAPVAVVTSEGRALVVRAGEIPDGQGRARGADVASLCGTNRGERPLGLVTAGDDPLVLVTERGVVKRVAADAVVGLRSGRPVIAVRNGDRVVAAFTAPDEADIVIAADDGQALRTALGAIRMQGPGAAGVAGMKLRGGARVVGAAPLLADEVIVAPTTRSGLVAVAAADLPAKGRGGQGVRLARLDDAERL
ncbi:MAG: DNA topoisomerase 4 subunit A, partial [Actinomyces sp.]